MKKYKLSIPKLKPKPILTEYSNALTVKFNNKRATVIRVDKGKEDGWILEFKKLTKLKHPKKIVKIKRGIQTTTVYLTKEAGEIVMVLLA